MRNCALDTSSSRSSRRRPQNVTDAALGSVLVRIDPPRGASESRTDQVSASNPMEVEMSHSHASPKVHIKRAYDAPSSRDGTRVLVDRSWPRGLRKEDAAIYQWMKDTAPSNELRKWFGHGPARWEEFRRRYGAELEGKRELVSELREIARRGPLTLL